MYEPTKADKFTFGLWTVGNPGTDPFGKAVRPKMDPRTAVERLSKLGAYGLALHDTDLVPIDAKDAERRKIVSDFRKALQDNDMVLAMATCNLFWHPVFKDGAFTSSVAAVRRYALQKTMRAMDVGAELGAKIFVFWGGREGAETDASKDCVTALKRYRDAFNFLASYALDQKYPYRFAIEPKPNEPRGDIYLPTTGSVLAFIETLERPDLFGVNPEVAHETMAGLNFYHSVAQVLERKKLFHIDLNAQKIGRYDQDLRFGSEDIRNAFFLVKLLEDYKYDGVKHFDSHPYRTEDPDGVWDFAAASMRTYKILQAKVREFNSDPEIQKLIIREDGSIPYSPKAAKALKEEVFDIDELALRGHKYEKLDQLFMEVLMGSRSQAKKPQPAKVKAE